MCFRLLYFNDGRTQKNKKKHEQYQRIKIWKYCCKIQLVTQLLTTFDELIGEVSTQTQCRHTHWYEEQFG